MGNRVAAITNVRIFDGLRFLPHRAVLFRDGLVEALLPEWDGPGLDGAGMLLAPGLIDLHTHGVAGHDVLDPGGVALAAGEYPRYGVTAFCPGAVPTDRPTLRRYLEEVARAMDAPAGARVPGAYLEGPYLSHGRRGANNPEMLRSPADCPYEALVGEYADRVIRVTLAPELPGAMELIPRLAAQGVAVSLGHTAATAEQVREAADRGLASSTHTFNGMEPLHHRLPGAAGAVLADERIHAEFIPDLIHLDPLVIRLLYRAKGERRCYFCTDSMAAAGMPDGRYQTPGGVVTVAGGTATCGGSLAGSSLTMDAGLRNLVYEVGVPLGHALRMATANPAAVINRGPRLGRLCPGSAADCVLLDGGLRVKRTIIAGRTVFEDS